MNRFDFYPGDYLRDTGDLEPEEDGIYLRLMFWYYANERPIEDKRAMLISRATTAEQKKITQSVLSRFFEKTTGVNETDDIVWKHNRIDAEITKLVKMRKRAQDNGKKGGRPPGFKSRAKAKHNPDHNPDAKLPSPSPSPSPSPTPSPSPSTNKDFERFWKAYPNRTGGKPATYKAWEKARKSGMPDIERLLSAIEEQSSYKMWIDGYIPMAKSWINQGRWDDERPPDILTKTQAMAKKNRAVLDSFDIGDELDFSRDAIDVTPRGGTDGGSK
jgi:uncharacterized protein YdaU (DUF1376 family)